MTYYEEGLWDWGSSRETSLAIGEESAVKAIELEEFNPDGLSWLAMVKSEQTEFQKAVDLGQKAVSLSPTNASNVANYAVTLLRAGKYKAGLRQIKRAIRLSPIYPVWYLHILGVAGFALHENEQALSAFRVADDATDADSSFKSFYRVWLAICLDSAGHDEEARSVAKELLRLAPDFRIDKWWHVPRKDWSVRERAVKIWSKIIATEYEQAPLT